MSLNRPFYLKENKALKKFLKANPNFEYSTKLWNKAVLKRKDGKYFIAGGLK